MPVYEYRCKECGEVVEFRSSVAAKEEMAASLSCGSCGSGNFTQVFSGFAVAQDTKKSSSTPPMGGCPGGMCNLQ